MTKKAFKLFPLFKEIGQIIAKLEFLTANYEPKENLSKVLNQSETIKKHLNVICVSLQSKKLVFSLNASSTADGLQRIYNINSDNCLDVFSILSIIFDETIIVDFSFYREIDTQTIDLCFQLISAVNKKIKDLC